MHSSSLVPSLSLLVGLLAATGVAQKTPDIRLDRDAPGSSPGFYSTIAAAGDNVYVCWRDARTPGGGLLVNRSADRGATWSATEVRIDTGPAGSLVLTPLLAASGNTVVAVWVEQRPNEQGSGIYANRSVDGGATWLATAPRLDTGLTSASVNPQVAIAGNKVYVTWEDDRANLPRTTADVYFARSTNSGLSWSTDRRLNSASSEQSAWRPQIAAAGNSVYVVWEDYRDGSFRSSSDIYVNRSLDGGASWLTEELRINTDAPGNALSRSPSIAASGTDVYVAWQEHRAGAQRGDIHFNRSLDFGESWLAQDLRLDTDLPAGNAASGYPTIATNGTGVFVSWGDQRGIASNRYDVYLNRSLDRGTTWLASDVRVNASSGNNLAPLPGLVLSDSAVAVAWPDVRNSSPSPLYSDLYANWSGDGGLTWLSNDVRIDVGKPAGTVSTTTHAVAASGHSVYATWHDTRNGFTDVFFTIPFGLQRYGAGKPGSGGLVPILDGVGPALVGETFALEADNALGGANAVLALGPSRAAVPLIGGTLLVGLPRVSVPVVLSGQSGTPGDGALVLPLTIPDLELFVGVPLFFQLLPLDAGASFGVSMSNGIELWMG